MGFKKWTKAEIRAIRPEMETLVAQGIPYHAVAEALNASGKALDGRGPWTRVRVNWFARNVLKIRRNVRGRAQATLPLPFPKRTVAMPQSIAIPILEQIVTEPLLSDRQRVAMISAYLSTQ